MIDLTPIKKRLAAAKSGERPMPLSDVELLLGALEQAQSEAEWMRERLGTLAEALESYVRTIRVLAEGDNG